MVNAPFFPESGSRFSGWVRPTLADGKADADNLREDGTGRRCGRCALEPRARREFATARRDTGALLETALRILDPCELARRNLAVRIEALERPEHADDAMSPQVTGAGGPAKGIGLSTRCPTHTLLREW
jgi:hypothetical protein